MSELAGMTRPMPLPDHDEATRRRRVRRTGLILLAVVAVLIGLTVAYVELFASFLRDPERPPTVTAPGNPRVLVFEVGVAGAVIVALTAIVAWRRWRSSR